MCNHNISFYIFFLLNSSYLSWDYNNPEKAVLGVVLHSFEWLFMRIAPIILIGIIMVIILTRKKS